MEGGHTFRVRGPKLWNRIPLDMRKKNTTDRFKNALKNIFYASSYVYVFTFLNPNEILRLYLILFSKF